MSSNKNSGLVWKKIVKITVVVMIAASLMVGIILKNYSQLRDALVSNEQDHLLIIAQTTAKGIENRFRAEGRNLELLSKDIGFLEDFKNLEEKNGRYTGDAIRFYYRAASPGVNSLQIIKASGEVMAEHPSKYISSISSNISDLEDVKNGLRGPGYHISRVYFEGKVPYIYILQPIVSDGETKGILRAKISIENIYENFVKEIRIGKKGYASIKTSRGVFLMHPKRDQIGHKAIDLRRKLLPDYDWRELDDLFKDQESGESGTRIYHSVWVRDREPKLVKKFNAYAPVRLQNDFWIVTLASDYGEVVERIRGNYYSTIVISSLIVLSFIFIGVYVYMVKEREKKLEREAKHLKELKKLNIELEEDIEKRKVLEQELLKTMGENKRKELMMIHQSRHAAMGEMIGNIAHQWRQPLSSLSLIISNIEDIILYGEEDREYIDEVFKRSRVIIRKMSETIDDFRNFFKPKTQEEEFTLGRLIDLITSICGERLKHYDVELRVDLDRDTEVVGYFNQLCQVLLNIINNAIDALIENRVEGRRIELTAEVFNEGYLSIFIKDNGGGIPEEILEKIFDPYFSTKGEKNGTGLGLHMAKMIIEKNFDGTIEGENIEGGSVFKIVIPTEERLFSNNPKDQ